MTGRRIAGVVLLLGCALGGAQARAAAFVVQAETEAQLYQFRSYQGTDADHPILLARRRLVTSLGLDAFELIPAQDVGFESSVRVFADFGFDRAQLSRLDGVKFVDADLLYAHLDVHAGPLRLRAGRQIYGDVSQTLALDGLWLRYELPLAMAAELYGGLWVKGSGFYASGVYQPDGIRESDARRLAAGTAGADPTLEDLEPLVGAKLHLPSVAGFSSALGYRKGWVDGQTDVERATAELRYLRGQRLQGVAGADYDLVQRKLAQARVELRYDGGLVEVSAQAMRLTPLLSASSIWAYFATAPRDEARLRVDVTPPGPVRLYVQGTGTRTGTELNSTLSLAQALPPDTFTSTLTYGGSVGGALQLGAVHGALDATLRTGYGGRQLWVDATCGLSRRELPWSVDARLSVVSAEATPTSLIAGTFYGAQLWGTYQLRPDLGVALVVEENQSPFARFDTKVFAVLKLRAGG